MDPSLAPDFIPPSEQRNRVPTTAGNRVPTVSPIQAYELEEAFDSQLDINSSHFGTAFPAARRRSSTIEIDMADISQNIPRISSAMSASPTDSDLESNNGREKFTNTDGGDNASNLKSFDSNQRLASPLAASNYNEPTARQIIQSADLEEVPLGVTRQAKKLVDYQFPVHRLADTMLDDSKVPLVLVACGSFSPITYLHLRMFEMAMDSIREHTRLEVIGGYYSPVSDNYQKPGLAKSHHRVRMCELACERTSSWLMVDAWESLQPTYTRTALVLDHFNEEINVRRQGVGTADGQRKPVKIMLLAGGDLIESMGEPNVWAEDDLHHILGRYGCIIVERTGSDVRSFLLSHDIMYEHRRNVLVIKQLIYNDISSTKVRLFLRRGMSVQYLLPNSVIRYILEHGLYINESEPVKQVLSEKGD
ncbi:nicotinamide-nucleotide adenylyltransferase NMA1 [Sugiyamaella lignohabitans]|uniref:Nicotinamide-nucleotide adenylyltransferase n=1 Tax=Sugiyamaella lignohabitans TaxID=796027 RepID=A0A161HFV0_9ASCO|nr:nicotinamide-nucleotide adenylyltransferase NMA1 [Sugiyamaella lignohabitans]ANB14500.1 nicotinamide-nucleotide adenylyltransferase NMA1 [Sugiyamaella lignohabitans]